MKYKIIIKPTRKLTKDQAEEIIVALNNIGYKSGSLSMVRACNSCDIELPDEYEHNLCPNCEAGWLDAKRGHD